MVGLTGSLWQVQITSFGGLDLETKYPNPHLSARRDHLPIAPSKAHPDNGTLLALRDSSSELRKKSYVKTRNRHSVLLASLQPYNRRGPEIYLSKRSYQTLVKYIQYSEPQDGPTFYASVHVRGHDPERAVGGRQRAAAPAATDDVAYLLGYQARYLDVDRTRSSTQTPSTIAVSRTERQPLLPAPEVYRPRRYESHPPLLPTTYSVRSGYGYGYGPSAPSGGNKLWQCVKIILWIALALSISYGVYRGGRWTIAACGRAVGWTKEEFGLIAEKARSLWSSFLAGSR